MEIIIRTLYYINIRLMINECSCYQIIKPINNKKYINKTFDTISQVMLEHYYFFPVIITRLL